VINPGECGGWLTGKSTIAMLDLNDLNVQIINL
jgi:predicted phosphodiesterase